MCIHCDIVVEMLEMNIMQSQNPLLSVHLPVSSRFPTVSKDSTLIVMVIFAEASTSLNQKRPLVFHCVDKIVVMVSFAEE